MKVYEKLRSEKIHFDSQLIYIKTLKRFNVDRHFIIRRKDSSASIECVYFFNSQIKSIMIIINVSYIFCLQIIPNQFYL